jgi:hypothetical protein
MEGRRPSKVLKKEEGRGRREGEERERKREREREDSKINGPLNISPSIET